MASISTEAATASGRLGSGVVATVARQTSFVPGSTRRVNRSQLMASFLSVQGTSTARDSVCSRPSRTIQARSVKPPR